MKYTKKILIIVTSIILIFICFLSSIINVYATSDSSITDLYNSTNTYEYKYIESSNGKHYVYNEDEGKEIEIDINYNNETRYNFSKYTGIDVEEGDASVTILTHGLGSTASDWSNNGNTFAYTSDSLITRLYNLTDSYVYLMDFYGEYEFYLYDLTNEMNNAVENEPFTIDDTTKVSTINDISKHIIIIFKAYESLFPNDYVYSQFNYGISQILYQYKQLNNGILPKLNLIGHSRGGITNMQYALDHPDLIDSIYSIGTPYCGSTSASVDALLFDHRLGSEEGGEDDIVDELVYSKYINEWNDNYERYEHINVLALGGYSTFSFLGDLWLSEPSKYMIENLIEDAINKGKADADKVEIDDNIIQAIVCLINLIVHDLERYYIEHTDTDIEYYKELISIGLYEISSEYNLSNIWIDDVALILCNEIDFGLIFLGQKLLFKNDGFVDLNSQLGIYRGSNLNDDSYIGYRGFNRISKCFTMYNCDVDKTARYLASIVHNLEARDTELLSLIIRDIKVSNKSFETYYISETEVGLLAYTGNSCSNTVVLPTQIDGKTVTEVGKNCFAGNEIIETIVVSNTIEIIHDSAFASCINLSTVDLSSATNLTHIGSRAFDNCEGLTSLTLPYNVSSLGNTAFAGSGITTINSNSIYFPVENNTLYDANKTELIFSPNITSLIVPETVLSIRENAFEYNSSLISIDLSNVTTIENYAFIGCNNLETIIGEEVTYTNKTAFLETSWLESNVNNDVIMGSVLIEYKGNDDSYTIPDNITYISMGAFSNDTLEKVYIGNNVETIERFSFSDAESLEEVYVVDICRFVIYNSSFNSGTVFYVAQSDLSYYNSNFDYDNYIISTCTQTINFYLDGQLLKSLDINYYEQIPNVAVQKPGYSFKYWLYGEEKYYVGNYLDILQSEIDFHAYTEPNVYKVYLEDYFEIDVTYGLFIPANPSYGISKDGYMFLGWYTEDDVCYIDMDGNPSRKWFIDKNATLYAKWQVITYNIMYDLNGGTTSTILTSFMQNHSKYTIESKEISLTVSPTRFGYKFRGWQDDEGNFVTKIPTGSFGNIHLTAIWYGENIEVYSYTTSKTVNVAYAIMQLPSTNFTSNCHITVSGSCKQLYIITGNSNITYTMYITIEEIGSDFELYFNGVKMQAPNNFHAIEYNYNRYLNLYIKGTIEIKGGNTTTITGVDGDDGKYGINCYRLTISGSGNITVIGGNGANGINGTNGIKGANGTTPPSGSFVSPIAGDDGANGTNGTRGGNGGNGGYGIYAKYSISISGVSYTLIGGNGGDGGDGGNGGNGGNGASDTSTNIFNGVGDPGNGGDGGHGGNGGNGGDGAAGLNLSTYSSITGTGGNGGNGGTGGQGGTGGSAGDYGDNGTDGDDGNKGADGVDGVPQP